MPTDNVALPAATGKAATRDVTYSGESAMVQAVGLVTFAGADDAKTATDVDSTNPIPTSSPLYVSQTPTVTNGAYAAEDVIGGLLTFANAARVSGGSGLLGAVTIMCKSPLVSTTVPVLELAFFNQTFTNIADNGVWAPTDGDAANFLWSVDLTKWLIGSNNVLTSRAGLMYPYVLSGTTSLFAQLITHTAVTLTSTSDIIVGITCLRD